MPQVFENVFVYQVKGYSVHADVTSHLFICFFGGPVIFRYVANTHSLSCKFFFAR